MVRIREERKSKLIDLNTIVIREILAAFLPVKNEIALY